MFEYKNPSLFTCKSKNNLKFSLNKLNYSELKSKKDIYLCIFLVQVRLIKYFSFKFKKNEHTIDNLVLN